MEAQKIEEVEKEDEGQCLEKKACHRNKRKRNDDTLKNTRDKKKNKSKDNDDKKNNKL